MIPRLWFICFKCCVLYRHINTLSPLFKYPLSEGHFFLVLVFNPNQRTLQCSFLYISPQTWVFWQPTPVFLPGKSHGQRRLVGYMLCMGLQSTGHNWARMDMHAHTHMHTRVFLSRVEAPGCIVWAPLLTAANCCLLGTGWCFLVLPGVPRVWPGSSGFISQVPGYWEAIFSPAFWELPGVTQRITRGEMGKAYFFVTDLQKYFTYLGYTSPYCLYTDILFFPICGLSSHFALFPLMKRSFYFKCTVVPQSSQWTGFRTRHRHQNPGMLETHSWHSVSAVPHVWTQPTAVCSTLCIYWEKKKFVYKWTQAVQTHAVQGSTAVKFTDPLLYGLCFIFLTLRNPS